MIDINLCKEACTFKNVINESFFDIKLSDRESSNYLHGFFS